LCRLKGADLDKGGRKCRCRSDERGGRSSAANPVAAGRSKASSAGGARKLGQRPRQASCRAKGHGINSLHHLLGRGWGALVEEEVGGPTARGRRGGRTSAALRRSAEEEGERRTRARGAAAPAPTSVALVGGG